ncbi:NAD-dependent epimerase/dehydratase family protein [Pseudoduganella lutea]|uniref:NAD(P)-dependent oxidoreductase n=1 Tax=Pseudoduganella lutea TaxID=321985 RepID=A0A4P6KU12_9BURK|nr:NAD(P)-dependent oxidoreductase [Pseudoduganella lutea]QBE61902.1 NAD(P)-dependent oxidoreductase [Pseudoduganella lutea]
MTLTPSPTAVPEGTVFITGGAGRIGTDLRARLAALGYQVRFADIRPPADGNLDGFYQLDLADQDGMAAAMAGCRALVHLGGHPREADWETIEALNFTGAYNALMAARRAGISTVIYASSNHYGGLHPADTVLAADLAPHPTGLYGASKVFGESLLRAECAAFPVIGFAWRICAYKPEPVNARDLRMWCSPDDAARLVDRCLRWTGPGFQVIWGVSGNTRTIKNDPAAERIGYRPQDDAEQWIGRLRAAGIDTARVSEWSCLGGEKAADWLAQRRPGA